MLFHNVSNLCIKEIIIGADLEKIRFHWLETEFIINFDYYSQSCWFDTQDPHSLAETPALFNLLTQNKALCAIIFLYRYIVGKDISE